MLYIWGGCHLATPPPPDLSIWIAGGAGGGGREKEWGTDRMKGWVDATPNTHIYLLPGQGVRCVIAPHLAKKNLRSFMKGRG